MKYLLSLLLLLPGLSFAQSVSLDADLKITKITDHSYIYTAWAEIGKWGRVGSNGLIFIDQGKALMCDTPMDEAQTRQLYTYIKDSLHAKLTHFIPGHWHDDCVGGMDYLNKIGVETYANIATNNILRKKSHPTAKHQFTDSLTIKVGKTEIHAYFLGGGHATDNVVVWLPSEKILFGGCLIKDLAATTKGNTSDAAPLKEWAKTIERVERKFPHAKLIIPGHGQSGGADLLTHTKALLAR